MEYAYLPGTVRERIQDLIKERKITQAELADKNRYVRWRTQPLSERQDG